MPLPKPPAQKASLLAATDFESQAAPRHEKRTLKPAAPADVAPGPSLDLLDSRVATTVMAPGPRGRPAAGHAGAQRPNPHHGRARARRAAAARPSSSCWTPTC